MLASTQPSCSASDYLTYDPNRAAELVLALMYLDVHEEVRAWKGYPWDVLHALYERGLISNPRSTAKSVVLTEEGLARAASAFDDLLASQESRATRKWKAPPKVSKNRLSQLQTALVERLLDAMCAPHPDPAISSQVRLGYRMEGYAVVLFESRPAFDSPRDWQNHDVAKLKFVKSQGTWQLFCQFRDLEWHIHEPLPSSPELEVLVNEVQHDPTGIFWG